MGTLTEREQLEITRANESGRRPVVFVHGLWLLASSWDPWREYFEDNGYAALAPGWPDDPDTVAEAREHPEAFARKMVQQVTDHYLEAIDALDTAPVVIGHSFGGLIAQKIAGTGVAAATVSIDNAPFKGVLPLPASALKSAAPVLSNPANAGRGVSLTWEQYRYGWANNLDEDEGRRLYDTLHVPAAGVPLFQAAFANFNPFGGETQVDSKNPARGPLLIIGGEKDHTVPPAITNASYKIQAKNPGVTELVTIPNRGHTLTIDSGWREVADEALAFVQQHAPTA
ncbi:alpha/beta hydrolase [Microbacterium panaciterrae]|uniref:Alpha/beta fold hydrolase n=1 Tax=Microbacterium panaciterrae TaxID=985759 RepID=A0ABP8PIC6_9MICO